MFIRAFTEHANIGGGVFSEIVAFFGGDKIWGKIYWFPTSHIFT